MEEVGDDCDFYHSVTGSTHAGRIALLIVPLALAVPDVKLRPYPLEESQQEFGKVGVRLRTLKEVAAHA